MFFLPYSFRIFLISVLLGSYFRAKSVGSERKCFLVEGKVLCYFSPNATSIYSWEEALKQCKDNEATLPDLPNEVIAGVLERYLESQNADYRFWTSGRRIESQEWRWINGQYYNGSDIVKRHDADSQAVVRNDLRYLEQHPTYEKNYVCQHFGLKCQSGGAIELSEGCLVLISRERRNVFHARNSCLESGGDLPVIRTKEDLQKFQEVFWELKDHAQIWIGLRRHWWTWNRANDSADIRFSSWADREGGRLYKNCMVVDSVRFEWIQVDCSDRESVLCQSVTPKKALHENDDTSSSMGGLVAGIIIGILIMSVAVVIAVLILRKRIRLTVITETSVSVVMFTSLVLCIGSLILILLELTFPILSNEYDTKCYPVGNQRVCFFRPQFNYTWETWYKATAVCKRKNGTLPFMPDEVTQHAFEDYINSLMHRFSDDIWMAGREERKKEWTWSNGVKFNEPSYFTLTHSEYNSRHLQAILADDLVYIKEYLGNEHHYVCQFFGKSCQVNDSIPLKSGCVILNDGKALDFYDARNKCVEKGGDLPVIDGQDDLNKFRQVFTRTGKAAKAGLWLGLRRQWWIWNVTDRAEMKYCNWLLDNGFKPEGGCMVAEMTDYLWKQENCTEYKRFICQTGPANVEVLATPTSTNSPAQLAGGLLFFVAGLSIMALAILILVIVVVAVIVNKKRNARNRQAKMDVVPRETSYQHLEHRFHEKNNPKSDHQYMELQSEAKKRLLPTTARPLMSQRTEQGPEYIYDDIAEIRAPSYLDVVQ